MFSLLQNKHLIKWKCEKTNSKQLKFPNIFELTYLFLERIIIRAL